MQMSTKSQTKLSPLNRATRNTVVLFLYNAGYSVTTIADIMNMTPSTVSRVTDARVDNKTLLEVIFSK
jgi:DNA-binding MarR family transcriptional regulator